MPELPDVEVYRRNVSDLLVGRTVVDAWVHKDKRTPSEVELRAAVVGAKLSRVERDGKAMRFVFDNGNVLVVHLMLNGEYYVSKTTEKLGAKRISILFDEIGYFAISDFMGLATIKLNDKPSKVLDALDDDFDLPSFKKAIGKYPSKAIKTVLIDQKVVKGIGNKYSDEILWRAKVSPDSITGALPDESVEAIFVAIKPVFTEATKRIYDAHPGAINGKMRDGLSVHRQPTTPDGNPVVVVDIDGRQSHYSPQEQVRYA